MPLLISLPYFGPQYFLLFPDQNRGHSLASIFRQTSSTMKSLNDIFKPGLVGDSYSFSCLFLMIFYQEKSGFFLGFFFHKTGGKVCDVEPSKGRFCTIIVSYARIS